jgi:hypothetical protein
MRPYSFGKVRGKLRQNCVIFRGQGKHGITFGRVFAQVYSASPFYPNGQSPAKKLFKKGWLSAQEKGKFDV